MNVYLSMVLLFLIVVIAIGMVLGIGTPLISAATDAAVVREVENSMKFIDHAIKEVAQEGEGSVRYLEITVPGEIEIIPEEDALQYKIITSAGLFEHFTRRSSGNLFYISGADVDCGDTDNITLVNTYVNVTLNKIPFEEPLSSINTADNIISVKDMITGMEVEISNSSIVINNNETSSYGNGYSELSRKGSQLPYCRAHFYVNSTYATYDVYYTLYSGADFVVVDVMNIIEK